MLHCSSTSSYSQTSIFFTLLPVSGFLFFFFFSLRLRVTLPANFIIYLFSLPFFYSLIAKIIPLFHSFLARPCYRSIINSFVINSVLIIRTKVHSTRFFVSLRFYYYYFFDERISMSPLFHFSIRLTY